VADCSSFVRAATPFTLAPLDFALQQAAPVSPSICDAADGWLDLKRAAGIPEGRDQPGQILYDLRPNSAGPNAEA
jgi:hypothetical protein